MTCRATIMQSDALAFLKGMPAGCVQTCVTSPPYYGLRDYGTGEWEGGAGGCDHKQSDRLETDRRSSTLGGGVATIAAQELGARAKGRCRKCGARRVDQQVGLEPTPAEYVARLVEIFGEVRRVLRKDGTLWCNLGDTYAASGMGGNPEESAFRKQATHVGSLIPGRKAPDGVKPKDLLGIPWMLAFALREPRYTGSIKDERDRVWLAAMLDAEGCMFIQKRKAGQHNGQGYFRTNDNYGPGLEISNTHRAVVERIMALVGKGSICEQESGRFGRKQTLYRWNLRTTESREFVRELYPFLVAKQHQARLLYGCPPSGSDAEAAHEGLKLLHQGSTTTADFPEPPTMFEPGWYLRSEIIWKKPNPMPESVTDRPTKAHEQLFLLSKSAKYYYDAAAIAEKATGGMGGASFGKQGQDTNGTMAQSRTYERPEYEFRNRRSVWTVTPEPYPGAHFAVMPTKLVEPCILAGSRPGDLVLDPFAGSGTVLAVAVENGRNAVGCDLNPAYVALAENRLATVTPDMFREVV